MARDGSGVMSIPYSDFIAGTVINSTQVDSNFATVVAEITNSLPRDGQAPPTANIPFNSFRITGLGSGVALTDSLNLGQSQNEAYQWGGTTAGTANAQTLSLTPAILAYTAGLTIRFMAGVSNTAGATLAVNGLAAKTILKDGVTALAANDLTLGKFYEATYDGTNFQLLEATTGRATITTVGTITTGTWNAGAVTTTGLTVNGAALVSGTSTTSFVVGQNGLTNPALTVDTATASSVTGLKIRSAATGSGVVLTTLSSAADEPLFISGKGTRGLVMQITSGATAIPATTFGITLSQLDATVNNYNTINAQNSGGGKSAQIIFINETHSASGTGAIVFNIFSAGTGAQALKLNSNSTATFVSSATATAFIPSGSTVPTNGMYLQAANTIGFACNSLLSLLILPVASAANYLTISAAAVGNSVGLATAGSDASIGLTITAKSATTNSALINLSNTNGIIAQFSGAGTGTLSNYFQFQGLVTGNDPLMFATGTDTNVGMRFSTKGTGSYNFLSVGATFTCMTITSTGNTTIAGTLTLNGTTTATICQSLTANQNGTGANFGVYNANIFNSAVTAVYNFYSIPTTAAAAFTLPTMAHFYAAGRALGGGSTVTNQFGFMVESTMTTATNNYGFYGDLAVAANRYNLYMNGTADNYIAGRVGIGSLPASTTNLLLQKTLGGATAMTAFSNACQIQSSVTSLAIYNGVTANTQAAAFTCGSLIYFYATQGTFGASSAVTTQYGFYVENTLTGATNNFAYYANIAAAANRYNFFANGTADNVFAGNVRIGSTAAPTVALDVAGDLLFTGSAATAWTAGFTGFSANPTMTCSYKKFGKIVILFLRTTANGTSNATGFTITGLPFAATGVSAGARAYGGVAVDNGGSIPVYGSISGTTLTLEKTIGVAASWTAAGTKGGIDMTIVYETT